MNKVYIITCGEHSDYSIELVCETREVAEAYLPNFQKFGARIEEWELITEKDLREDKM